MIIHIPLMLTSMMHEQEPFFKDKCHSCQRLNCQAVSLKLLSCYKCLLYQDDLNFILWSLSHM